MHDVLDMNTLYQKTIGLLSDSDIPLAKIAQESKVGYRWLCDLKAGRFSDPGVNKIQRIHDYLLSEESEKAEA